MTRGPRRAFVALGSNLGNRLHNLAEATRRISHLAQTRLVNHPLPVVETQALLAATESLPQPPYLNAVVEIVTALPPRALLRQLLRIEVAMGRVRNGRWGSRVIDLDLLLYGEMQLRAPDLVLPHPELAKRPFVLRPLAAIAPTLRIPGTRKTAADLLAELRSAMDVTPSVPRRFQSSTRRR